MSRPSPFQTHADAAGPSSCVPPESRRRCRTAPPRAPVPHGTRFAAAGRPTPRRISPRRRSPSRRGPRTLPQPETAANSRASARGPTDTHSPPAAASAAPPAPRTNARHHPRAWPYLAVSLLTVWLSPDPPPFSNVSNGAPQEILSNSAQPDTVRHPRAC